MRRGLRTRWVLKWVSTVVCLLIVVTWVSTLSCSVNYVTNSFSVTIAYGRFYLTRFEGTLEDRRYFVAKYKRGGGWSISRVSLRKYGSSGRTTLRALGFVRTLRTKDGPYSFGPALITQLGYFVPFWKPLALITVPTAFLWWLDRRRTPPGHCHHCGYDLTGNVSGVCPECGRPVDSKAAGRGIRSGDQQSHCP